MKKKAKEKEHNKKMGIKSPSIKSKYPLEEEKCIIDILMEEIKNGFPLRKKSVNAEPQTFIQTETTKPNIRHYRNKASLRRK